MTAVPDLTESVGDTAEGAEVDGAEGGGIGGADDATADVPELPSPSPGSNPACTTLDAQPVISASLCLLGER